jgi:hypothetical protein
MVAVISKEIQYFEACDEIVSSTVASLESGVGCEIPNSAKTLSGTFEGSFSVTNSE